MSTMQDTDLLYAAEGRCQCGAGLAHPLDHKKAFRIRAWQCSAMLKGAEGEHDSYPFAFYKIREETSINNYGGHTTRPPGTVARTVGHAVCPACQHEWESEPYSACGAGHHWFSGPCPACGYAVGGAGTWREATRARPSILAIGRSLSPSRRWTVGSRSLPDVCPWCKRVLVVLFWLGCRPVMKCCRCLGDL